MNTRLEQIKASKSGIFKVHSTVLKNLNKALMTGFLNHCEDVDVKRSHLFNGRYENIYLTSKQLPELGQVLDEACAYAGELLEIDNLKAGCWFNHMPSGAVTTKHSHDDDDELLSAVYYVTVPEHSGDLIIHGNNEEIRIQPKEGMFVFFEPDVLHEVTENLCPQARLSIGINFGKKTQ